MWRVISKNVVEGGVYIVKNFTVKDTIGTLKPLSSNICLRFSNATKFEACVDELIIPLYKFEFLDLGDLFIEASRVGEKENPEFALGNFFPYFVLI